MIYVFIVCNKHFVNLKITRNPNLLRQAGPTRPYVHEFTKNQNQNIINPSEVSIYQQRIDIL